MTASRFIRVSSSARSTWLRFDRLEGRDETHAGNQRYEHSRALAGGFIAGDPGCGFEPADREGTGHPWEDVSDGEVAEQALQDGRRGQGRCERHDDERGGAVRVDNYGGQADLGEPEVHPF